MRVLNKKYWPYQMPVSNRDTARSAGIDQFTNDIHARRVWCSMNAREWLTFGDSYVMTFAFKHEDDVLAFKLRWG